MQVNGTLINYYFHCKRQCYLHGNRLNLEDNSEQVKIGKAIHEEKSADKSNSEIAIDNIRLDKLTKEYLTEVKKSDADVEAAKWQLLYYLKVLKNGSYQENMVSIGKMIRNQELFKTKRELIKFAKYLGLNVSPKNSYSQILKKVSKHIYANRSKYSKKYVFYKIFTQCRSNSFLCC